MKRKKYQGIWGHCYSEVLLILEEKIGADWDLQVWSLYENTAFLFRMYCSLPKMKELPNFNEDGASSYIDNYIFGGKISAICFKLLHKKGLITDPENWTYGHGKKHTSYLGELVRKQLEDKSQILPVKEEKQFLLFSFQPKAEKEELLDFLAAEKLIQDHVEL